MSDQSDKKIDEGLRGNEKLEEHIRMLRSEPSPEMLAVTLTTVRRRMKEGGQMIVAVDAGAAAGGRMQIQVMDTGDGERWLPAFTSFDEQFKGKTAVMSTFMADIGQLLRLALEDQGVEGLLINPWDLALRLDKGLIRIIFGEEGEADDKV